MWLKCTGHRFTAPDNRQNDGKPRFITVGQLDGRMVVIVWTSRNKDVRVISNEESQ